MNRQCGVCNAGTRLLFELDGYPIGRCVDCGHQQCMVAVGEHHLDKQYGDDYFRGGGAGYTDYLSESGLLTDHGRRYARIVAEHCQPGTLLDIGCAAGFISRAFADAGWNTTGIDPNSSVTAHARDRLALKAHTGSLERLASIKDFEPPKAGFDLILMIQVVAHFFDLDRAFEQMRVLARPGSYCLVETWDSSSLTARVLGRRWHEYSPPSALHYFSRESLARLMAGHGFELVASGRPAKRIRLDHAASLLQYKYGHNVVGRSLCAAIRSLPGKLEVPYPSNDLFWAVFKRKD